ncbi:MAG: NAD(P)H-dependent oxidoreductase [Chloroflexi bacterium]|nr:NAD(P)H-dependent oxidoreductase [Chloroflexota bacterium]
MKVVILDGSANADLTAARIRAELLRQLDAQNHAVETFTLRESKIGACAGDFFCWVRSPGVCNTDDDNRVVASAIVNADLLIYLTPITFGGYSATLKKAVDHQIQNISPFFATVNGETHHARRYECYPDFLAIGWQAAPNPAAEGIFRRLAWRNRLNFYAQASHCEIVTGEPAGEILAAQIESALEAIARRLTDPQPALPSLNISLPLENPPRRVLLLVGSPRGQKSTSHSLGAYLMEQLAARGVETEIAHIYPALNNPQKMDGLFAQIDSADLTVLAFPLYVDTLPAPVILLLERLAAHRAANPAPGKGFAALANCGFPEAHHNDNALAICAQFSAQTGLTWLGSLALGAGEGMVHGEPLEKAGGQVIPLKKALELAAHSLSVGQPIPAEAQKFIEKPFIPAWLYHLLGGVGWKQQAKRWGAQNDMKRTPYQ